jgi:methyl-accepting chemotaxis protein
MLKNLRIATKMLLGFGLVAAIALFLGLYGYYGAEKNLRIIEDLGKLQIVNIETLLTIKAEMNEIRNAYSKLLIPDLNEIDHATQYSVVTDAFKNLDTAWKTYEPLPQTEEEAALWKEFVPEFSKWRETNGKFIELAKNIDAMDLGDPNELADHFAMFRGDHYKLNGEVLALLHEGREFEGGDDHEKCNLGKWLATFKTTNPQLQQVLKELAEPHARFHAGARKVKELVVAGMTEEAKQVYLIEMAGNMDAVFSRFEDVRKIVDQAQELDEAATRQALEAGRVHQVKAVELLDKIIKLDSDKASANVEQGEKQARSFEITSLIISAIGVVLAIVIALLVTRAITRPINTAVAAAEELSRGNLTVEVKAETSDETGRLLAAMDTMAASLRNMFAEIARGVETLATSSGDMAAISRQLSSASRETADKSTAVATASEEMSANFQSVSAAMEQSAANVNVIASSTEEMTATVNEIAESAEKARGIAESAVNQAQSTSAKMADLEKSAQKIGQVTETITEISEQTNLLALNATIEAARAGEAGKGFAVVANEIKELARQTAAATIDIKNQIGDMQGNTNATISDISNISEVIFEISTVINAIATAVEEQSAATTEIAGNIAQASQGIAEVNENMAQSSVVVNDIARDISDINQQSEQVGSSSGQVQGQAQELAELARKLEQTMAQFRI